MLDVVNRRPNFVIALIAGYFLFCIGLRLAISTSLEIDESEQAFVSQFLMLGYGSQPPSTTGCNSGSPRFSDHRLRR